MEWEVVCVNVKKGHDGRTGYILGCDWLRNQEIHWQVHSPCQRNHNRLPVSLIIVLLSYFIYFYAFILLFLIIKMYHMRLLTHEDGYLLVSLSVEDKIDPEVNRFLKDSDLYHVQVTSFISFFFLKKTKKYQKYLHPIISPMQVTDTTKAPVWGFFRGWDTRVSANSS